MSQCRLFSRVTFLCVVGIASATRAPVAAWYAAERDEETRRLDFSNSKSSGLIRPDGTRETSHENFLVPAVHSLVNRVDNDAVTLEAEAEEDLRPRLSPLKLAAIVTTVILQLSGLRTILEIQRDRDVKRYDPYPFFAILAGATQWCLYGVAAAMATGDWTHITMDEANGPGLCFGVFYVTIFFRYCPQNDARRAALRNYLCVGAFLLCVQAIAYYMIRERAVWYLGLLGAVGSAQIAMSPLKTLPEVIRSQSTRSWPFDLCLMNFVQSAATGSFGLASSDAWVWMPNAVGLFCGAFQLVLCAAFSPRLTQLRSGSAKDSANAKTLA